MAAQPTGPVDVGGELTAIVTDSASGEGYSLTFYPDGSNEQLRAENKPMSFYYIPNNVRLARETDGSYRFHFQQFGGVLSKDSTVGVKGDYEIAGGLLTFSTTMSIPPAVFKQLTQQFTDKLISQYSANPLLTWKKTLPVPNFQPITINSGTTSMDNQDFGAVMNDTDKEQAGGNVAFVIQGNGPMNLSSEGINAYSTMVGLIPAEFIKAALLGGSSSLTVRNQFKYWLKSVGYKIHMKGDWSQVYQHFSASLKGHYLWASADLSASFDKLKMSGALTVDVEDNPFIVKDAADIEAKTKEMVMKMFAEKLQDAIFEKVPMEKPAEASDSGWFWGVGVAMKFKSVRKEGTFQYDEIYKTTLERETRASGTMEGIYKEIKKKGPETEKKYFSMVILGNAFEKIHVVAKSNAYWKTPEGAIADPINSLSLEVGYKESNTVKWKNSGRYKNSIAADVSAPTDTSPAIWTADTKDRLYIFDFMKNKALPAAEQNKIYIRKTISFNQDPRVAKSLQGAAPKKIESVTEERIVELRTATLGKFGVNFTLENGENVVGNSHIKVMVTCSMTGLPDKVFEFNGTNADQPKKWELWFENAKDIPNWKYKVSVSVSGKTFAQKVLKWGDANFTEVLQKGDDLSFLIPIPPVPAELEASLNDYLAAA